MSIYVVQIGESLAEVFERAATTQPEQFAGYTANLDFWLGEYEHLASVAAGYDERFRIMREAYERYVAEHGGPHNFDDVGIPYAAPARTTRPHERKAIVERNRKALARLIRRALELKLIDFPRHDDLLERIGAP